MASDKRRRKDAKGKAPRAKPAAHPDGDRRRRGGPDVDQAIRDKRARTSYWDMPAGPSAEEE